MGDAFPRGGGGGGGGGRNGSMVGKTLQLLTLTKYLDLFLTNRMTFSNALNEMASKSKEGGY